MEPGGARRPLSCPGSSALGNKGRWGRVQTSDTTALPHSGPDDPRSLHTASSLRPEARSAGRTGRPVTYPCSPAFRLFH